MSSRISANINALRGASFEGFSIIVHPAAIAGATFPIIWCKGKFQGVIKAHTPTGSLQISEFLTTSSHEKSSIIFA